MTNLDVECLLLWIWKGKDQKGSNWKAIIIRKWRAGESKALTCVLIIFRKDHRASPVLKLKSFNKPTHSAPPNYVMQLRSPVDPPAYSSIKKPIILKFFYGQEDQLETQALDCVAISSFMAQMLGRPVSTNAISLNRFKVCLLEKKNLVLPTWTPASQKKGNDLLGSYIFKTKLYFWPVFLASGTPENFFNLQHKIVALNQRLQPCTECISAVAKICLRHTLRTNIRTMQLTIP